MSNYTGGPSQLWTCGNRTPSSHKKERGSLHLSVGCGLTDPQLFRENHTVLQLAYQAALGRMRADDGLSECRTGGASRQGLRPLGSGPYPTPAAGPRV